MLHLKWSRKRDGKGHKNVAVAAVARKLTVAIWYLLRGCFTPLQQIDASLHIKLGKLATAIGKATLRHLGYTSKSSFSEEKSGRLLHST